jgi:hypothetical protein
MYATNLRYYAFVSQFVDAVTTSALADSFERARAMKRLHLQARRAAAVATGVVQTDRAA